MERASGFLILIFICLIIVQYGVTYYYLLSIVYCPKKDINKQSVNQELDGETEDLQNSERDIEEIVIEHAT